MKIPFTNVHFYAGNPDKELDQAMRAASSGVRAQVPNATPKKIFPGLYAGAKSRLRTLRVKQSEEKAKPISHLSELPHELQAQIAAYLDPASLGKFRLSNKTLAEAGAAATKNLVVENPADLRAALVQFASGGLNGVTLKGNSFTDQDIQNLPRNLQCVRLVGCSDITPAGLAHLPPSLKQLTLEGDTFINEHLRELPSSLKVLNLHPRKEGASYFSCPIDSLAVLEGMMLEELNLQYCGSIRNESLENLRDMPLRKLLVSGCDAITDNGVYALRQMPLNELTLRECRWITDAVKSYFAAGVVKYTPPYFVINGDIVNTVTLQVIRYG